MASEKGGGGEWLGRGGCGHEGRELKIIGNHLDGDQARMQLLAHELHDGGLLLGVLPRSCLHAPPLRRGHGERCSVRMKQMTHRDEDGRRSMVDLANEEVDAPPASKGIVGLLCVEPCQVRQKRLPSRRTS